MYRSLVKTASIINDIYQYYSNYVYGNKLLMFFYVLFNRWINKNEIPNEYYVSKFYVERFMFVAKLDQQIFLDMVPFFLINLIENGKDSSAK